MGVLSKLIDPNALPNDPETEHEFDSVEDVGQAGMALEPTASETAALQQIVVSEAATQSTDESVSLEVAPTQIFTHEVQRHDSSEKTSDERNSGMALELVSPQSPEAIILAQILQGHRWNGAESDDAEERYRAVAQQFFMRRLIASATSRGQEAEMQDVWSRNASPDAPSFEDVQQRRRASARPAVLSVIAHAAPYAMPAEPTGIALRSPSEFEPALPTEFPQRTASPMSATAAPSRASEPSPPQQPGGGGGGGFGFGDLVKTPFTMVGAAGSLVLAGLNKAGSAAHASYVRSRVNGHAVLAGQLEGHSQAVVTLSEKLKSQGMGDLIDAIKRTGNPVSEVFDGMQEGGKHDALGKRFDRLMKQPEVAQTYADLQAHIHQFDSVAKRYAKTGLDLNLDHDTPIRTGAEAMVHATQGIPVKEGGAFKQLAESLREMTEKIAQMIQRLFSRFSPA